MIIKVTLEAEDIAKLSTDYPKHVRYMEGAIAQQLQAEAEDLLYEIDEEDN